VISLGKGTSAVRKQSPVLLEYTPTTNNAHQYKEKSINLLNNINIYNEKDNE